MTELHDSKPNGSEHIREYFTRWIESLERLLEARFVGLDCLLAERDKRYEQRFTAQESAVKAAFEAQSALNRAIMDGNKEAITKAENAQNEYNKRSNEFRGALDDQNKVMAKEMLSRNEYSSNHTAIISKVGGVESKFDEKIEDLKKEVAFLRESKSAIEGRTVEKSETKSQTNWGIGIVIAVIMSTLSLAIGIIEFIIVNSR
jgi:hypothetical protein